MCLAVPMKVIEKNETKGKVQAGNVTYDANFTLIPDAGIGDYVLIHAGFAIEKLDVEDAEKTLELFRELEDTVQ